MGNVQRVVNGEQLLAIIIPASVRNPGVSFLTSNELSQQLAHMHHPVGHRIAAHFHNPARRSVEYTQEALFIRSGALRVDFYDNEKQYLESRLLRDGDVILLVGGGHGFEVLEELDMVEVKQGPYVGAEDKTVFPAVSHDRIRIEEASQ